MNGWIEGDEVLILDERGLGLIDGTSMGFEPVLDVGDVEVRSFGLMAKIGVAVDEVVFELSDPISSSLVFYFYSSTWWRLTIFLQLLLNQTN